MAAWPAPHWDSTPTRTAVVESQSPRGRHTPSHFSWTYTRSAAARWLHSRRSCAPGSSWWWPRAATGSIDVPPLASLRIEPPAFELAVELGDTPPTTALQVFGARSTATSPMSPASRRSRSRVRPSGRCSPRFSRAMASPVVPRRSRPRTASSTATALVTANVYGAAHVDGTPPGLADAFAAAESRGRREPVAGRCAACSRRIPRRARDSTSGRGRSDDAPRWHDHRTISRCNNRRARCCAAARIALRLHEWQAIARTALGGSIAMAVASLPTSAPATAHVSLGLVRHRGSRPSALLVGVIVDSAPRCPRFDRYDMPTASLAPMLAGPNGACVGLSHRDLGRWLADRGRHGERARRPGGILFDGAERRDPRDLRRIGDAVGRRRLRSERRDDHRDERARSSLRDGSTAAVIAPLATGELATSPTVSPDGSSLAYAELDTADDAIQTPARQRDPRARVERRDARRSARRPSSCAMAAASSCRRSRPMENGLPYGHTRVTESEVPTGTAAVRSDGSGTIVELTTDPADQLARWASPIAPTRAGGSAVPSRWSGSRSRRSGRSRARPPARASSGSRHSIRIAACLARVSPLRARRADVLHGPLAIPQSSSGATPNLARSASRPRGPSVAPASCTMASASRRGASASAMAPASAIALWLRSSHDSARSVVERAERDRTGVADRVLMQREPLELREVAGGERGGTVGADPREREVELLERGQRPGDRARTTASGTPSSPPKCSRRSAPRCRDRTSASAPAWPIGFAEMSSDSTRSSSGASASARAPARRRGSCRARARPVRRATRRAWWRRRPRRTGCTRLRAGPATETPRASRSHRDRASAGRSAAIRAAARTRRWPASRSRRAGSRCRDRRCRARAGCRDAARARSRRAPRSRGSRCRARDLRAARRTHSSRGARTRRRRSRCR